MFLKRKKKKKDVFQSIYKYYSFGLEEDFASVWGLKIEERKLFYNIKTLEPKSLSAEEALWLLKCIQL